MPDLLTTPEVAKRLGERLHRVSYAIDSYGLQPAGRIAGARVWTLDQVETIRRALARTGAAAYH